MLACKTVVTQIIHYHYKYSYFNEKKKLCMTVRINL